MKTPDFVIRWASNLAARIRPALERIFVSSRQAGVLVNQDTAMTLAEWFACVSLLSRTIASLPWCVNERTDSGRKELNNAISWLLNSRPNPEMSAFAFREAIISHAINWGNGYAEIQFDGAGRPMALWLLTPDRVQPDRDDAGNLVYKVSGADGLQTIMTPDHIFHVHGLGFDGLTGYSLVQLAARSIGVGIAQDTFAQSFYANGTVMGSVIEMPGSMNPQQIKDAEKYYNDGHQGPAKAFKVRVAPAGVKTHAMGMPMTDAQFVESRQLTITMAARWLGVPPHKIADLARSTNNNIEHQGIEFVQDAIVPWAMRLEQEADAKLIAVRSRGRVYTKLNLNALMRGDAKSRAEFYRTMTQIGAMSVNEVRALEELNSIGTAGDAHLVQLNQTTLEWLVKNPDAKSAQPKADPNISAAMTSMVSGHKANADSVISALTSVAKTVANLALKEQPTPVVNMHASPVTVNQGDMHLHDGMVRMTAQVHTPEVQNHVHVEPAAITVNAGDVNMPEGCISVEAHIDTPDVHNHVRVEAPVVNMAAPVVTVEPAVINYAAPVVNVEQAAAPMVQIDVHVPEAAPPVVNVSNEVNVPEQPAPNITFEATLPALEVEVTAKMPARKSDSTTKLTRDLDGQLIESTTQTTETDA